VTDGGGRPHFTGRAAVLAVVLCAIALSLAYPVREYLAQRRQIDQLQAQHEQIITRLHHLEQQWHRLKSRPYIEEQARDRLHLCLPNQMCYVIIDPATRHGRDVAARQAATPWYARLWSSVRAANAEPGKAGSKPGRTRGGTGSG
jgi:cell division protein FtsB